MTITLLVVVSIVALLYPLPLSIGKLPPVRLELAIIQGNSLIANYEPFVSETNNSYATLLGKDPSCPVELQCKEYVKRRGLQLPQGDAWTLQPNSNDPIVGGGVLLSIGGWGHIAYLEKVLLDSIYICEQNLEGCGVISCRWLDRNNPSIRGYIIP